MTLYYKARLFTTKQTFALQVTTTRHAFVLRCNFVLHGRTLLYKVGLGVFFVGIRCSTPTSYHLPSFTAGFNFLLNDAIPEHDFVLKGTTLY